MKFTKLAVTFLCSTLLLCGCVKNSDTAIKVNDGIITRGDFYGDFNRIKNVELKNVPKELQRENSYLVLSLKGRFVNDVITRELLTQEFEKRNIEASEDEIKAKKQTIIDRLGSEERFNKILKDNDISEKKLNSDLASEVKMDKFAKTLGVKEATNADAEKYYKQNKAKFNSPERVRISHILINTNLESIKRDLTDADKKATMSKSDLEAKAKEESERRQKLASDILKEVKANPKKFAQLAKEHSEDTITSQNGGDAGFITKEGAYKEITEVVFNSKVGVVDKLVESPAGTHIIIVTDKAAAGIQPFDSVKEDLKAYLTAEKRMQEIQNILAGLKANATIEYVDESLNPETIQKQIQEIIIKQQQKAAKAASKKEKTEQPAIEATQAN